MAGFDRRLLFHHGDDVGGGEAGGVKKGDGTVAHGADGAAEEAGGILTEAGLVSAVVIELGGESTDGDGGGEAGVKVI